MTRLSEAIARDRFLALPQPTRRSGEERRVGVEVEFAGMTETELARHVQEMLGGTVRHEGPYEFSVEGTEIGTVEALLDTAFRKSKSHLIADLGLELGREVIPVEFVTEPLRRDQLPRVEALCAKLRGEGAIGSRGGVLLSFGMHLNIEVAGSKIDDVRPVLTAFALLEDWLRFADPIDNSRRVLPFVDPYPRRFVRALLDANPNLDIAGLIDLYLDHTPTRNRSLDMLPLFRHLDPDRLERGRPADLSAVKARPTYHYRLPDSRIDEPDWRIAYEWNRWVLVERVAQDAALLDRLSAGWRAHDSHLRTRHDWCAASEKILLEADLLGAAA